MAFQTIKTLVRVLLFFFVPKAPESGPDRLKVTRTVIGLRYNLTEILSFDETRTRSRWKRDLVADHVRNSAH